MIIAGVRITGQKLEDLAMSVALADMTITDAVTGAQVTPADDLPGFVAKELGLNPKNLTTDQAAHIEAFIAANTL